MCVDGGVGSVVLTDRRSAEGDHLETAVLAAIDDHHMVVGLAAQRRNGLLDRRHLDGRTGGREYPDPQAGFHDRIPEFGTVASRTVTLAGFGVVERSSRATVK